MSIRNTGLKAGLAVAGLATAGVVAVAGSAFADTTATTNPTPAASSQASTASSSQNDRQSQASQDTPVTGTEKQSVIDAVKAKISGATITEVRKDPDGSYDALGTKADGSRVMVEVSKDLKTITENAGRQGGGHGGPGGSQDTPVTGTEKQSVIDAVKAKISGATITEVRKDPDGSYDALGTKADGSRVMVEVSTDLKTITENAGPADGGHRGGPGRDHGAQGQDDQAQGGQAQTQDGNRSSAGQASGGESSTSSQPTATPSR